MWLCSLESCVPPCIFLEGLCGGVLLSGEQAAQLCWGWPEPFSAGLAADQAEPSFAGHYFSEQLGGERAALPGNRFQPGGAE